MDWNTGASHTSNLQTKGFQVWTSDLSQQLATTCNFSQANSSTSYSGNEQTIKMQSNTNNKVVSQVLLQPGQSLNYQPVFQNASVSATNFRMPQHLVDRGPVSGVPLSSLTAFVQMQNGTVQNPWPNSNIHVFPSAAFPGTAVNSIQNTPQTLYMSPVVYNNCPQKNSNSIKTSVYPKANSFSKRQLAAKGSYNVNGPSTSQACATVPLNPASNHHLKTQQDVSWCISSSEQNNQNQINGLSSSAIAKKLQQYPSGHVFSTPYMVSSHNYGDTTQVIPPVASINPPPPYPAHIVQTSYGHLAQPVANTSNENVQNHQSLGLDQNSAEQNMQLYQKPPSEQSARETNEVCSTAHCVNECRAADQSNESAKSLIPVNESICKDMQISAPQATKLLEQEENLPSSSGNLSNIPQARLVMDIQNVPDFEKVLRQFKDIEVKHKLYIAVMKDTKTSDVSAHNKNPNVPLPSPSNTTQNQTSLLPHDAKQVFRSPSQAAVLNQALSLASKGSSQSHKVRSSKEHLYPILKDLLQGTVDESLLNAYAAEVEKNQSGNAAVQENGSFSTLLVPGGDNCENNVKSNEETSRESRKTSPTVLIQEPLMGTKNSLGFQQQSRSTKDQSANISAEEAGRSLLRYFRMNKAKIIARLTSSIQNQAASNGSSLSSIKPVVKECREKFQSSTTMCPELLQQNKSTCLQTSEQNVTTKSSGNLSDASSLSHPVAKAAVTTPKVQSASMTGNSCAVEGACSWEELKASLTLWLKNLPSPVNDTMDSTVSLSSEGDGDKILQTLENLPNSLTQNNQTTVDTYSVASSLENQLDAVTSSLLKGTEPQVAIVAPLMQSKENTLEVQENNPSVLYEMDPIIEKGNLHSLQKLISAVPATNRERSSMDTCSASDSLTHQNAAESTDKSGLVKAKTNSSNDCFLELNKVKSEVCSGDEISCLNPVSQKCITSHESDPNLLEPGDTAAVEWNDTVLQISSVCTLVQGDAFYNSQIANIFNISPIKCMKNDDASVEHAPYPQQNEQQPTPLEGESETKVMALEEDTSLPSLGSLSKAITEKPSKDLLCLEMTQKGKINARNSEEEKNNYLHEGAATSGKKPEQKLSYDDTFSMDLTSSDQELSENADLLSAAVEDSACTIQKENVEERILMEENHTQYSTSSESPVTLLSDQLTELLKEYPNGINDLEVRQKTEMQNAIKLTEREERTQTCGQNPGLCDAIDRIKITILDSQQGKEYFTEHIQASNKLKNNKNEILKDSEGKDRLSSDNVCHIETQQLKQIDNTNATVETTVVKTENETYCCMQGFMASRYAVKPCSCNLTKDLLLQSKNKLEDKPKGSESYKTDRRRNNSLQTSMFHPVDRATSGDQSNKFFKNIETATQGKESALSNQELAPSSFLEKLDHHKPKRTNEQEKEVLPLSAGSLKEETAEIEINDQKYLRENLCSGQTLPHLITESFKKLAMQPLSKEVSYNEKRDEVVSISKRDSRHHDNVEIKHRRKYEKYKIKQDTNETHMIKGPKRLSKGLKRQMAMETKHKMLGIQHSTAMDSTNLDASLVSDGYKNSSLHSEEHFSKQKCEKSNNMEKNNETKRIEPSEPDNSEHAQPDKEIIKKMNLDKYVCSKERENAWKFKRLLLNNRKIPKIQKQRTHSSIHKINSFSKETVLDAPYRDEYSVRSFLEKATSFSKKINKMTLQREQKKTYLNRVSFTQTAQESICLKKLEPSPSKSIWRMKSSSVSENMEVPKTSSSSSLQPGKEKPQMLEFKMCPEILFRTTVSEEQVADLKKLPEKHETPITAVKSKREDWLNYNPAKRRKTVESETQVDGHIPLDTALKLLDETNSRTVKDSKTTFQTYRKMHLEKRSQSLDSSPIF